MRFECICSDIASKAHSALVYLKEAYKLNSLNEIENIDYVLECLDISGDLEYLEQKLKENHIDY